MKRALQVLLAVTIVTGLALEPAVAHVRTARTRVKLTASDTRIDRGDPVVLKAKLRSGWRRCIRGRQVVLKRNGVRIAMKRSNYKGVARFTVHPRRTATWWVKVRPRRWGTHPHAHLCKGRRSKAIRIVVRP